MSSEKEFPVPDWLRDLQQKSWEPEILLSGIVLYGMFKVPDVLDGFLSFYKLNVFGNSNDMNNLVSLFKMGIYWLIIGLVMHLICRGIWIGMVGLSYTFPNGIHEGKLKYTGRFKQKVERTPSYEQIVVRLEKISSMLFSISFMLFMSLVGGYLFFFVLVIAPFLVCYLVFDMGFSGTFFDAFQYYVFLIVSISMLGLADFLTMGFMRRYKWFERVYWPVHLVISVLTLSRFYRPIYYGIVSHFNKWALFVLFFSFTFLSVLGMSQMNGSLYYGSAYSRLELWENSFGGVFSGYYQDQNEEKPSVQAQIPSDIISGNVLRLFIIARIQREDEMLEYTPIDSLRKVYPDTAKYALNRMIVSNYFQIFIDQEKIDGLTLLPHYHTPTRQRGYLAYIDITDLEVGHHTVSVSYPSGTYIEAYAYIPFYREMAEYDVKERSSESDEKSDEDFQPKPFIIRD